MDHRLHRQGPGVLASLRANHPVLCLGIRNARTPDIARMAATAGYEIIWIDLEHSSMSIDCAVHIASTARDLGMAAWVRIPEGDYAVIGRVLDGGATGIIVPKVETAQQAMTIAAACRFAPSGSRSQIALLPHFDFQRMPPIELTGRTNEVVVVQILIESAKGVQNIDQIAAVRGIDMIALGTNDFTGELGCHGDVRHPAVRAACKAIADAAKQHDKIAVIGGVGDAIAFGELLDLGFSPLIFAGIDTEILAEALVQRTKKWQNLRPLEL